MKFPEDSTLIGKKLEEPSADGYGNFGNLSKAYAEIRPTMPTEVIDYLFSHVRNVQNPKLLDVGCGTGIVTRQLAGQGATVTGTEIDHRMIEQAEQNEQGHIDYIIAPTEKLPLPDATFDAVTAFSAFHWFANEQAVAEIYRVLKVGGIVFIANRNQVGEMRKKYLEILQSFTDKPLPNAKKDYDPVNLLQSAGFFNIVKKIFPIVENLSVEQALTYVQSTSLWNIVPEAKKQEALSALQKFFKDNSVDGDVQRLIEIQTVLAHKQG